MVKCDGRASSAMARSVAGVVEVHPRSWAEDVLQQDAYTASYKHSDDGTLFIVRARAVVCDDVACILSHHGILLTRRTTSYTALNDSPMLLGRVRRALQTLALKDVVGKLSCFESALSFLWPKWSAY